MIIKFISNKNNNNNNFIFIYLIIHKYLRIVY